VNKNMSYRNPPKQVPKKGLTIGTFGVLAVGAGGPCRRRGARDGGGGGGGGGCDGVV